MSAPLLSCTDIKVHFKIQGEGLWRRQSQVLKAVDGVSFELARGETLGIVGESGCGKSTLARAILGLIHTSAGTTTWLGKPITGLPDKAMRALRDDMQVIFQDPLASLNPRMTVGEIIAEPLRVFNAKLSKAQRQERVKAVMARVGLLADQINRYPHEFSGGQCQRIGIARALIVEPSLIICDEPVSALDVSIQAQIVNLLMALQRDLNLSLIFIAHDLSVVRHISHRVMVMYLGHVVEIAPRDQLYAEPRHPYTQALISAVPIPDPDLERGKSRLLLTGDLPSPLSPPSGCAFRTRCPKAGQRCADEAPALRELGEGVRVACHFA